MMLLARSHLTVSTEPRGDTRARVRAETPWNRNLLAHVPARLIRTLLSGPRTEIWYRGSDNYLIIANKRTQSRGYTNAVKSAYGN